MSDPISRLNEALEGRYRIERQLGEGGMATVYLADDLRHERKVALKVLKPELAAVVGAERFLGEIKTTANLQHPHILPLFDSGEAAGFLFYVMPYVEGESLQERLAREHQLPVDEAIEITKKVAGALHAAHERGVIHRDIKPANILMSNGEPLVSDFGIALAVGMAGGGRLTETGLSMGTPYYMSPEQATGDQAVGPASDIYALACVLYEMLVAEPPYTGGTPQAILGKIIAGRPASAREHRRSVPPNVDAAIRKALEKVPADRFAEAHDFARALSDEGFRHGGAAGPDAAADAGPWKRATIGASVIATAFAFAFAWSVLRPAGSLQVTRVAVEFPQGQEFASRGDFDLSQDGALLVYQGPGNAPGSYRLWARRWAALEATPIPGTEGGRTPAVSPDGQEVAFGVGAAIRVVPVQGGVARTIAPDATSCCPRWSPDGAWIYFRNPDLGLSRAPSLGGPVEPLTRVDTEAGDRQHDFPDVLPGGEAVLFDIYDGDADRVAVLDVASGDVKDVIVGAFPRYTQGHLLFSDPATGTLFAQPFDVDEMEVTGAAVPIVEGLKSPAAGWSFYASSQKGALVYARAEVGGWPLVLVDREGREERLGFEPQAYFFPRFSPDGRRLAVDVGREGDAGASTLNLWVLDLERGTRTQITFAGDSRFPLWTRAGDRLTHSVSGGGPMLSTAADGSGQVDTLMALEDGISSWFPTSWSRDGTLVFHRQDARGNRDLWVMPPGGEPVPVVATPAVERDGSFSPDGRWLAYRSNRSGTYEVYVRPYPGPGPEITLSAGGGEGPVWARDGSEIFYRTDTQMMVVDVSDLANGRVGTPRALFDDPYMRSPGNNAQNLDVAPDGQHFVFPAGPSTADAQLVLVQNWLEELRR